jgi:hypothetical protein
MHSNQCLCCRTPPEGLSVVCSDGWIQVEAGDAWDPGCAGLNVRVVMMTGVGMCGCLGVLGVDAYAVVVG